MPEITRQIIGLEKDLVASDFGAVVRFHVVRQYSVSLYGAGSSAVTFASFVSREAYEAGKNPMMHVTAQVPGAPTGDSAQFPTWFAQQLLDAGSSHDLSGATPIYVDEAEPSPRQERSA